MAWKGTETLGFHRSFFRSQYERRHYRDAIVVSSAHGQQHETLYATRSPNDRDCDPRCINRVRRDTDRPRIDPGNQNLHTVRSPSGNRILHQFAASLPAEHPQSRKSMSRYFLDSGVARTTVRSIARAIRSRSGGGGGASRSRRDPLYNPPNKLSPIIRTRDLPELTLDVTDQDIRTRRYVVQGPPVCIHKCNILSSYPP